VREGFEPSVQFNPYGSLANYWIEPLSHLTVLTLFREGCKNRFPGVNCQKCVEKSLEFGVGRLELFKNQVPDDVSTGTCFIFLMIFLFNVKP
jgi:hypothetical protein